MVPRSGWFCDACGGLIEDKDDGWVEWLTHVDRDTGTVTQRGLRLVHDSERCQYPRRYEPGNSVSGLPLSAFLGADGLTHLLKFLAEKFSPPEEVLELIKRLHTPGYEHARGLFERAIQDGEIERSVPEGYYFQRDIEATLAYAEHEDP
jgi:hypothetical protein